ncbi:MAG: Bug family tripartite tricarboxylate transporter substrate binding protein [Lautropia sp.]
MASHDQAQDRFVALDRRQLVLSAVGLAAGMAARPRTARAQAWPARPITVIAPAGAGTPIDVMARMLGPHMGATLGQPLVVKNVTGGGGTIGLTELVRSARDGHTVGFISVPLAIIPSLYKLPFDVESEVVPVAIVSKATVVLAANAKVPAGNVKELIALAQSRGSDKPLIFGTPLAGSLGHLAFELFRQETGVPFLHVPYRTNDAMMTALAAGEIDLSLPALSAALPFVKSNHVRILGAASGRRPKAHGTIPTLVEQGVGSGDYDAWVAMIAPSGLPAGVTERLASAVRAAIEDPQIQERMQSIGYEPDGASGVQASGLVKRDTVRYADVIRRAGIKVE